MPEANLTRFGPITAASSQTHEAAFRALDGDAMLVLQGEAINATQIQINGNPVTGLEASKSNVSVSISLKRENTISITSASPVTIRVTQKAEADLGLERQGYFGLNTSDMERQRELYKTLGFIGEIYPAGPETSTTFARALGFPDDYLIYVSLHSLENPPNMPFVDTVQFRGDSYRDEPPYAKLNHIGMAFATYSTLDLDGDIAYLTSKGVKFLSPPATDPDGERFVFFTDQDGAFLKLVEVPSATKPTSHPNLQRLVSTNMNVTDLERSREFYRLMGFTVSEPYAQSGDGDFAAAHGFDGPIAFEGINVSLGEGTDGATIALRKWITPYDDEPPYAPPVNHLGIDRINFYVKALTPAVKAMNDLGFEQLGPIGGMPEVGIVFFFDPDGIKVQIAGPQSG